MRIWLRYASSLSRVHAETICRSCARGTAAERKTFFSRFPRTTPSAANTRGQTRLIITLGAGIPKGTGPRSLPRYTRPHSHAYAKRLKAASTAPPSQPVRRRPSNHPMQWTRSDDLPEAIRYANYSTNECRLPGTLSRSRCVYGSRGWDSTCRASPLSTSRP